MGEVFKYFDKFVIKGYDEKGKQMNKWDQYHKVPLMQVPFWRESPDSRQIKARPIHVELKCLIINILSISDQMCNKIDK